MSRSYKIGQSLAQGLDFGFRSIMILLLLLPAGVITVISFSGDSTLNFPPKTWGLRQYQTLVNSDVWMPALMKSLAISVPAAALALVVGVPAAYVASRSRLPGRGVLSTLGLAPIVLPGVAYAVALYTVFIQWKLVGTAVGLILVDMVLAVPYVIIVTSAALVRIPRDLELVAMTLGASRSRAVIGITFRLLVPAFGAAFIFAFITAFDEATFVQFVGGSSNVTLPKAIFDSIKTGLDPVITAIGTTIMVATGLVMLLGLALRRGEA